jgi:hypothetical protein
MIDNAEVLTPKKDNQLICYAFFEKIAIHEHYNADHSTSLLDCEQ